MRRLYNPAPELSGHYYVVPRHNCRAVLAFRNIEFERFYPVAAIGEPLECRLTPWFHLSFTPLPHLPH